MRTLPQRVWDPRASGHPGWARTGSDLYVSQRRMVASKAAAGAGTTRCCGCHLQFVYSAPYLRLTEGHPYPCHGSKVEGRNLGVEVPSAARLSSPATDECCESLNIGHSVVSVSLPFVSASVPSDALLVHAEEPICTGAACASDNRHNCFSFHSCIQSSQSLTHASFLCLQNQAMSMANSRGVPGSKAPPMAVAKFSTASGSMNARTRTGSLCDATPRNNAAR